MRKQRVAREARASKRAGGASGVEGKLPSFSSHITFPFFSSHLLACVVSLPYASLIKGKGVIRFLKMEKMPFHTGKGFQSIVEGGRKMMKGGGGEVRAVEAERTGEGKEKTKVQLMCSTWV